MLTIKNYYNIAVQRMDQKQYAAADNLLSQILSLQPNDVYALHLLAKVAIEQKEYRRALELLAMVTEQVKDNWEVLVDLAIAYKGLNRAQDSVACLERAAIVLPDDSRVYRHMAEALLILDRYDEAHTFCHKIIGLEPESAIGYELLGTALQGLSLYNEALSAYQKSIDTNLDNWKALTNIGLIYKETGHLEDARTILISANALDPLNPFVAVPLVEVLLQLSALDEAQLIVDSLTAQLPNNNDVILLKAILLFHKGNIQQAMTACIDIVANDEKNRKAILLLCDLLICQKKFSNAFDFCNQLLNENPQDIDVFTKIIQLLWLQEKFEEANEYIMKQQTSALICTSGQVWNGEDLKERTILIYSQMGMDEFNLLCRYAKLLKSQNAVVYAECKAPMVPILDKHPDFDAVFSNVDANKYEVDFYTSLERLPGMFGTPDELFERPHFSSLSLKANILELLNQSKNIKIGFMWRKETDAQLKIGQSLPLECFEPLIASSDSIEWVSFQTVAGRQELEEVAFSDNIKQTELENATMDERIACLSSMDLFITSDTLTGQIAAAFGIPVWFLTSPNSPWHYGTEQSKLKWHYNSRIFRNNTLNDWEDTIAELGKSLELFVEEKQSA